MSGADLRNASMSGNDENVKECIIAKCNPCSVDEYGLSALHYAVWNGHVECVKLLVCNTLGVDVEGKRSKSINLASCMGYSALHLAALDCPQHCIEEITTLLLIGGVDVSILCGDGKTALEIASELKNIHFISAFEEFQNVTNNKLIYSKLSRIRDNMNKNYCYQSNSKTRGKVQHFDAKFTLPDFLFNDETRTGNMPDELQIHEHQIKPLAESGFSESDGVESLNCLNFTKEQAIINKNRRERLMLLSDPHFKPVHID